MTSILAVDGGQSGIRLRHSMTPSVVEAEGVVRSTDTVTAIATTIAEAWKRGNFPPVDRVVLGLTAAPTAARDAQRLCESVSAATGADEVWLSDDTVTAHCGALSGGEGVCLVVGTGVACLALSDEGSPRSFDGHGYLLGDEGGAFWIGRRALRTVLRERDLRVAGSLTRLARARFGDLTDLHVRIHEAVSPVNDIAQFARDVLDASITEASAANIIREAAARLHATVADATSGFAQTRIELALGGRLLAEGSPLRTHLVALLLDDDRIVQRSADGSPLDGALLLGSFATPERYGDLVHLWKSEKAA